MNSYARKTRTALAPPTNWTVAEKGTLLTVYRQSGPHRGEDPTFGGSWCRVAKEMTYRARMDPGLAVERTYTEEN
ncbi:hypothetical protein IFR05_011766, partial [Cadophora sp. M221]